MNNVLKVKVKMRLSIFTHHHSPVGLFVFVYESIIMFSLVDYLAHREPAVPLPVTGQTVFI